MAVFNSLALDFEPEVNSSIRSDDYIWGLGDRKKSVANTTVIIYSEFFFLTEQAKQMIAKMHSFKSLNSNWDSYGAEPPSADSIDLAISFIKRADRNLLPFYFTAPGPNGELVIEFRQGNKEAAVYFNPDRTTELILIEGNSYVMEGTLEGNYKDLLSFING